MELIALFLFGLVFGSFISALSWRLPRGMSILNGRSICPGCKRRIEWQDNIPVVSFVLLGGKCRKCGNTISLRYPSIELATALTFLSVGVYQDLIARSLSWTSGLGSFALPYFLFVAGIMITVFVTDLEKKIIPDELVFIGLFGTFVAFLASGSQELLQFFLAGAGLSLVMLAIHLITKGRGMGLGDVKLTLLMGSVLGFKFGVLWFFLSFIIGALFGSFMILGKKARFGDKVPFGPFLIISFAVVSLFGPVLFNFLMFYWGLK